jgi:hypothetical protein
MSNAQDIHVVEISLETAKKAVQLMRDLDDLHKNPLFKKIIIDGYFTEEASRLVLLKAAPAMVDEFSQEIVDKSIIGIGALDQYFRKIYAQGNALARDISANELTLDELRAEA